MPTWINHKGELMEYGMNDYKNMDNANVSNTTEAVRPQVLIGYDGDGNIVKVERVGEDTVQDTEYSEDNKGNN